MPKKLEKVLNEIQKLCVVIEIPKLSIPFSYSFRIKDNKNTYYLYPGTFTKTLKQYNMEISRLQKDLSYHGFKVPGFSFYFDKISECFALIVSEINIAVGRTVEEIFDDIRTFFKPLMTIFSFLLSDIFTITKVFFFKKRSWGYKFIRMLESPNFHKEISKTTKIKQFISKHDVEFIFPCILTRMCGKEHYLEFIDGYLAGKIKSFFIGNKISNYWNCLEHFANKFCKDVEKGRILTESSISAVNKILKGAFNLLKKEDLIFPDLSLETIRSGQIILPDNRPSIQKRIIYMCKRKSIDLTENEKLIITIINEIRNKLYHEENYLTRLFGRLRERFQLIDPTLLDIGKFSKQFSLIVEKVILRFFKIIPYYFVLQQKEYYHFLDNKVINLPTLRRNEELRQEYHNKRFNMEGLTEREASIKHLVYNKNDLIQKGRYISIIKFYHNI